MTYAAKKSHAEPLSHIPFNWKDNLPTRGWKLLSEEPPPIGRRQLIVHADTGRVTLKRQARHGGGPLAGSNTRVERVLTDAQKAEALELVNRLWATNPTFRNAHRTNVIHLVTLVLVDNDSFKAFSSCDPTDELHVFNQKLWQWATE